MRHIHPTLCLAGRTLARSPDQVASLNHRSYLLARRTEKEKDRLHLIISAIHQRATDGFRPRNDDDLRLAKQTAGRRAKPHVVT